MNAALGVDSLAQEAALKPLRIIAEATDNGKTVLGVPSTDFVCAGASQGSLVYISDPEGEQLDIATRDRLACHSTGVTPSFVLTLNVRLRQSRVGCSTRAASINRHNSQELTGRLLVSNHERRVSACRLMSWPRATV